MRKRYLWLAAVAAVAVVLFSQRELIRILLCNNLLKTSVTREAPEVWTGGATYEHVAYAEGSPAQYLDLYVPESETPVPLIIMIHGGGFWFGDSQTRQAQLMYLYFRDHGYACATVNYRLSSEAAYPAAVEDVKAAVRYLRANAATYGYDPERFVTWGESAGGYLSLMAALTPEDAFTGVRFIGEDAQAEPVSGHIQMLTEFYGVTELGTMEADWRALGIPKLVRSIANSWLSEPLEASGGKYGSVEEVFLQRRLEDMSEAEKAAAEPVTYMATTDRTQLPQGVLIWHGDSDITVPYLESERLAALATERIGADNVWYELFRGYGHAADGFYSDESLGRMKALLDSALA